MNKNNKLTPKLRFPEFGNEGDWVEKKLADVCEVNPSSNILPERFVYIDLESVDDGFLKQKKVINLDGAPSRAQRLLQAKDIIFQMVRPYQQNNYFFLPNDSFDYVASTGYAQLRAHASEMYLYQYLHSQDFLEKVLAKCTGSNYPAINSSDLSNISVVIPIDIQEQRKIASCLSSLDEVILAHSQKLKLLKDHKKGLMQNLFPQEGEMAPKYRFEEFEKEGNWSSKKLYELIKIKGRIGYRGYTINDIVSKGEGAISMSPSNIDENWALTFDKSTYITWEKYDESPEIILEDGFIVLVKTGSSYGKAAYIKNLIEKATINPQLVVLKPKKITSYFLYLLIINASIQKQIQETVVGGAIPTLSQDSISKFEILVPKAREQEKIADCLLTLNNLIISQTQRIEQLKLHKKGLMQVLFPKIID